MKHTGFFSANNSLKFRLIFKYITNAHLNIKFLYLKFFKYEGCLIFISSAIFILVCDPVGKSTFLYPTDSHINMVSKHYVSYSNDLLISWIGKSDFLYPTDLHISMVGKSVFFLSYQFSYQYGW